MDKPTDCYYIPANEIPAMTDKELIQHVRKCKKQLAPLEEELQKRREQANTSCPI